MHLYDDIGDASSSLRYLVLFNYEHIKGYCKLKIAINFFYFLAKKKYQKTIACLTNLPSSAKQKS